MKRVWDIIDKTQPGVEITQYNERPVRFEGPVSKFTLTVAALVLATASAFYVNIPSQVPVFSGTTAPSVTFQPPPLERFFDSNREQFSKESEKELLSSLDNVSVGEWVPTEEDILRSINISLNENRPEQASNRTDEDIKKMLGGNRRKFA